MRKLFSHWLNKIWYEDVYIATWFTAVNMLFVDAVRFRKFLYRLGIFQQTKLPVPVIIIGNLTVGGTGKTPVVLSIAQYLQQQGYNIGIISRGYGGNSNKEARLVTANSSTQQVGDEAIMLYKNLKCPIAVSSQRVQAAELILNTHACEILLSDDGLQHYALQRDIEILVIDGERRFGNGYCLPFGPLREPAERTQTVDFILLNGGTIEDQEIPLTTHINTAVNLKTAATKPLTELTAQPYHALAGIGNPNKFFQALAAYAPAYKNHIFPDHHKFTNTDINFNDLKPILMTEKDAVKCSAFATEQHWFVPLKTELPEHFFQQLLTLLKSKTHGHKTT